MAASGLIVEQGKGAADEILRKGKAAGHVVGLHEVVPGVGAKLLGGEEAGDDGGVSAGETVSGGFHIPVAFAGPTALTGHGRYGLGGGLPQAGRAGRNVSRRELRFSTLQRVPRGAGVFVGGKGSNLLVGVQQGEHTGDEFAHQAAVVGQLMGLDEAVVELGAELLGHGELVAQVVVAGLVGQSVGGGLKVAGVAGRPAACFRHGGQGVGGGIPQVS